MVFISYSHDSPEFIQAVKSLADRLRSNGIDVEIDQYHENPPEGWPRWMERMIRDSEFVLVLCSQGYFDKISSRMATKTGLGAKWESMLTYVDLYDSEGFNNKFIPVLMDRSGGRYIPKPIAANTNYIMPRDYGKLLARLSGKSELNRKPPLGPSSGHYDTGFSDSGSAFGDSGSSVRVATDTDHQEIDIVLNESFENFSSEKQSAVMEAIKKLLEVDYNIRVKRMKKGSVVLTLDLPPKDAARLLWAIKRGELEHINAVDARLSRVRNTYSQRPRHKRLASSKKATLTKPTLKKVILTALGQRSTIIEFNELFALCFEILKQWGEADKEEEYLRLRVYQELQNLCGAGLVIKNRKSYILARLL